MHHLVGDSLGECREGESASRRSLSLFLLAAIARTGDERAAPLGRGLWFLRRVCALGVQGWHRKPSLPLQSEPSRTAGDWVRRGNSPVPLLCCFKLASLSSGSPVSGGRAHTAVTKLNLCDCPHEHAGPCVADEPRPRALQGQPWYGSEAGAF